MRISTNDINQSLDIFPYDSLSNCWQVDFFDEKGFCLHRCQLFFVENDKSRKNRKLAALNKVNDEEQPRINQARDTNVSRSQEEFISQVSGEIGGRVTRKLWKEFSRTESCISGALAQPDVFILKSLTQSHSRSAPETSRNTYGINQGKNEHDSQSDPHPDARVSHSQTNYVFCPDDC